MSPRGRCCRTRLSTIFVLFLCVAFILLLLGYLVGFESVTVQTSDNDFTDKERFNAQDSLHGGSRKDGKPANKWEQIFNQKDEILVCKQPKFTANSAVFDSDKVASLKCGKTDLMMAAAQTVVFDPAVLNVRKLSKCIYRGIDRVTDNHFQYTKPHVETDWENFGKKIKHDFFRVGCFLDKGKKAKQSKKHYDMAGEDNADYDQLFAQIYPPEHTLERLESTVPSAESLNMSVLILGLDSMSHLSFQRNLPKTYSFLKNTLGAVIMNGYNILGDGTAATIVPLLTGKSVTELPEVRNHEVESGFVDQYPLIWTDFEHNGYVTLFAEDEPSLGMFNLRLNGFDNEPTDHYMRTFWQAAWDSKVNSKSERYCLGSRPKHQFMLNYIKEFFMLDKYGDAPRFAFGFLGELSHSSNDPVKYMDKDLSQFLRNLNTNGKLDNTLLILMGDHGARYRKARRTLQGKLEERLPMMSFVLPKWFQRKYPTAMSHLKTNAGRLTTAYDVHELLQDLMDERRLSQKPKYNDRGISLFKEIPKNRTCESSGIEMHWCTCLSWSALGVGDTHVVKAAREVMDYINRQVHDFQKKCSPLHLKEIVEARRILPNEKVLKYFNSLDDDHRLPNFTKDMKIDVEYFQVTIVTSPNNGYYEATVMYNKPGWVPAAISSPYQIVSDISRIDRYGNQPYCIQDERPELMKYCFCPDYKSKSSSKTSRKPKFFMPKESWIS